MNRLSDYFHRFLRLSIMREFGIASLIAVILMIVLTLCLWLFSENKQLVNAGDSQFMDISAASVRKNDPYFHKFIQNIKFNNGVLILGTSESGPLGGYNYTELLNSDSEIKKSFSVFYGAGRFCEMYLPLIAESPELWKDLEVLVFVNPTYWRQGLNQPSETYQKRYLDKCLVENSKDKLDDYDFDYLLGDIHASLRVKKMEMINNYLEVNVESLFYNNLNSYFTPNSGVYGYFRRKKSSPIGLNVLDSLKAEIDSNYNAKHAFVETNKDNLVFPFVDSSQYRYRALNSFIKMCADNEIKATYIIGPYNGVMIDKLAVQSTIDDYKKLRTDILHFFTSKNQKIIDLTDLSDEKSTFIDVQHHSAYGGYLIYNRLKEYYE